ncbi:hypothetical protein [Brevibacterium aurantiacum]|uniref:hypothetical protein n=1 Tax=Brevibacterium aurantiacum TaxID=273384 RepID=UPI0011AF64B8|nr:hypothetical protein [Brevibacterium aurantiacum]
MYSYNVSATVTSNREIYNMTNDEEDRRMLVVGMGIWRFRRVRRSPVFGALEHSPTPRGSPRSETEVNRAMTLFGFGNHAPIALLSYKTDDVDAWFGEPPAQRLRTVIGSAT